VRGDKKRGIGLKTLYGIVILAEMLAIVAGASGIMELIHGAFDWSQSVPNIVWLVGISILLGIATMVFLMRFFSSPIFTLGDAMKKVADGDFTVRLDDNRGFNELRQISESFNKMAKELQATEILQSDFVSNVSHEFKTPINAIEGYATLLQRDDSTVSEEDREYIEKILFNTRRLSTLVGNILLLSKVDNQGIPDKKSAYRLDEQIRQAILELEPKWLERDTEFDVELDEITYLGNEALMFHVFANLLSNAIKFGPRGGTVTVRLERVAEDIVFSVSDEGEGIPVDSLGHIFEKFYQGDSSHKAEGNGLGLALVKRILSAAGGEVKAENLAEGGCRFTVVLHSA